MNLAEQLDGAKYVRYDPNLDAVIAWFGGHGIHAYTADGKEFAYWNIGDFAKDGAELDEVEANIEEHIKNQSYLDFY